MVLSLLLSIHGGVSESKRRRKIRGGSEMNLELFMYIVIGVLGIMKGPAPQQFRPYSNLMQFLLIQIFLMSLALLRPVLRLLTYKRREKDQRRE